MIIISHRANLDGPNPETENNPRMIEEALGRGFHVETDVWLHDNVFCLGHDRPTYPIDLHFLKKDNLWVHAKNLDAAEALKDYTEIHWFWHESDKMTLTSRGYIWCYPGYEVRGGIMVDKGQSDTVKNSNIKLAGVCTNYPMLWP